MNPGILIPLIGPLIDRAQPDWKQKRQGLRRRFSEEVPRAIGDHHVYVSRWCLEAHPISLGTVAADAPTIELTFQTIPRRVGVDGEELDELDLLVKPSHLAVLGDLGAGKTTTLRRLARYVALEEQARPDDDWKFVVLIVCRDERWDTSGLYDVLGKTVGITGNLFVELDNPEAVIRDVLDTGALVVIDGLDEVPARHRAGLESAITQLGRYLRHAKIVVSCRSADYVAPLSGFEIAEIRPLSREQITTATEQLLGPDEAVAFNAALEGHPARDLVNRPLFLTFMAAIFRRRGTIPDRPIDLYEAITRLVIQEWDEQRRVRRVSKWAGFGVDDKRRFLADLAYELTRRELFRFDTNDLVEVYAELADRYQLPTAQARQVVHELESHTGLLSSVGDLYEFSHLSLQEFLAADAMVRAPASARGSWWSTYPAVAAVTVAMSSNPNSWFSELVTRVPTDMADVGPVRSFLNRLGQERPRFVRSEQLGHELLRLLWRGRVSDIDSVALLHEIKAVRDSVADALTSFTTITVRADSTRVARYGSKSSTPVDVLSVSTPVLKALLGEERFRQVAQAIVSRS
jgi:hypothetical protein